MKNKEEFEMICYETDDGRICLEFGLTGISFSKERFIELAENLNEVRLAILSERFEENSGSRTFDYRQLQKFRGRNEV